MAKKNASGRKSSGAASIITIEDHDDHDELAAATDHNGHADLETAAPKKRAAKAKAEAAPTGNVGVGEVRKAAAFANSVGGLDKAIALLQILKVAKEVQ